MKLLLLAVVEGAVFVALLDGIVRWPLWLAILAAIGLVIASWSLCAGLYLWVGGRRAQRTLDRLWPPSPYQFEDKRY